jgi:hypothetical protein
VQNSGNVLQINIISAQLFIQTSRYERHEDAVDTYIHALLTLHWTDMGDQLHVPAALPPTLSRSECCVGSGTHLDTGGRENIYHIPTDDRNVFN